jgi:hypothetical protein
MSIQGTKRTLPNLGAPISIYEHTAWRWHQSMIPKSGCRFSEKIMLPRKIQLMIRFNRIGSWLVR